jgi:hypothetical protein
MSERRHVRLVKCQHWWSVETQVEGARYWTSQIFMHEEAARDAYERRFAEYQAAGLEPKETSPGT